MYHIFCNKCGRVCFGNPYRETKCDICGNRMKHVPEKDISENELLTDQKCHERVNEPNGLYEELVKTSPEFDQYLFDHRDEILAKQSAKFNTKMSGIERGASIATFGLFSKKINKTFKCNGCGYTW